MDVYPVRTDGAPEPIGPYSQAVTAGGFLFASGQIPIDPATGRTIEGGADAQAARVFDNLTAVLKAAGAGWESVVKITLYLKDMDDFQAVNAVYGRLFSGPAPARSTVEVSRLPKGALVEADLIAWLGGAR